jgi:hypothetical protein
MIETITHEERSARTRYDFLIELEPCSTHYEMYDR